MPGYEGLSKMETFSLVREQAKHLGIKEKLLAFTIAAERVHADRKTGSFHLVVLDPVKKEVKIKSYGIASLDEANREYAEIEKLIAGGEPIQAVLVRSGPIEDLRKAYPNYFLDTHEFVKSLDRIDRLLTTANKRLQRTV